ncbi:MAG TPA: hypothetical protein VI915_03750 [Thermoplasmata archaeon]|nr:hypothetical protein [Thermoplasmata archaeon]
MAMLPLEVLTRTKKGELEVRSPIDRGRYVRYNYLRPETPRTGVSAQAAPKVTTKSFMEGALLLAVR